MFRKLLPIILFLLCSAYPFAFQIDTSNYKNFIGRKIKFTDSLLKGQHYKIANKKLRAKKYIGKTSTISHIELDKKGNINLYLTTLFNEKEKTIKIKTKTKNVNFENITLLSLPKPLPSSFHKKTNKRTAPSLQKKYKAEGTLPPPQKTVFYRHNYVDTSGKSSSGSFIMAIIFTVIPTVFIYFLISTKSKNRELTNKVTTEDRGEYSEKELILILRHAGFPQHLIFHDLYIPIRNRTFSQIDLIMLTKVGLIVFEVKDYSGWIFGNGKQHKWTQVLNYGQDKYRFYNPIMQNHKHIYQLKKYLRAGIPCFSVIVFFGECELKDISFIPKNTFIVKSYKVVEAINHILSTENEISLPADIPHLLHQAFIYGKDSAILTKHIQDINDMLGKDRIWR